MATLRPLKAARIRSGMTLRQLADACRARGVSITHGQLSRIENGQYAGRPQLRAALISILDLEPDDFET